MRSSANGAAGLYSAQTFRAPGAAMMSFICCWLILEATPAARRNLKREDSNGLCHVWRNLRLKVALWWDVGICSVETLEHCLQSD